MNIPHMGPLLIITLNVLPVFSSNMFTNIKKGHRLEGFTIATKYVDSLIHCVFQCTTAEKSNCKSINIGKLEGKKYMCQLNSMAVGLGRVDELTPSDGIDYWEPFKPPTCEKTDDKKKSETGMTETHALHFPGRPEPEIQLTYQTQDMTALSLCFWAKTASPSPVFYFMYMSLPEYLMCFANKGDFYVVFQTTSRLFGGKMPLFSDGAWHSICVTWSNSHGDSEVFADGKTFLSKRAVTSPGLAFPGGGEWTFTFNSTMEISNMDIWDRVLTSDEITQYASSCASKLQGNVKKWEDFVAGVVNPASVMNKTAVC